MGNGEWGEDTTPGVDHRFGPSEAPDRKMGSVGSIFPPLPTPHFLINIRSCRLC